MDGGSTDGSVSILDSSSGVIWKSEQDRGQSHALNKAFDASNGDIIGWINSDDAYADRRAVEAAVQVFDNHPDVGVVYGHGLSIDANNRLLKFLWSPPLSIAPLTIITPWVQPAVFVRRSVLETPMVDESLHFVMDKDLWRRLSKKTQFHRLNVIIGVDRFQPSRKTETGEYLEELQAFISTHPEYSRIHTSRTMRKVLQIGTRYAGLGPTLLLPNTLQEAFPLDLGSMKTRFVRQAFKSRARG